MSGRQEGMQQGMYEVAKRLLAEGVARDIIIKTTGFSLDQLREMTGEALQAS